MNLFNALIVSISLVVMFGSVLVQYTAMAAEPGSVKFADKVTINQGFYEGCSGTVIEKGEFNEQYRESSYVVEITHCDPDTRVNGLHVTVLLKELTIVSKRGAKK